MQCCGVVKLSPLHSRSLVIKRDLSSGTWTTLEMHGTALATQPSRLTVHCPWTWPTYSSLDLRLLSLLTTTLSVSFTFSFVLALVQNSLCICPLFIIFKIPIFVTSMSNQHPFTYPDAMRLIHISMESRSAIICPRGRQPEKDFYWYLSAKRFSCLRGEVDMYYIH